ncbi:hypothetical protein ACN20G_31695 (plasmid) [Streptomyces sp. BI20]
MLQTVSTALSQHTYNQGERFLMNILTDILAGFFHFLGWLV